MLFGIEDVCVLLGVVDVCGLFLEVVGCDVGVLCV